MPVDPVGTALSAVALLASFKGAVDGYLLLESFFDKDGGALDLAISYHVERCILETWGDIFSVSSQNEDSPLEDASDQIKQAISTILARIESLHKECERFLEKHFNGGKLPSANISGSHDLRQSSTAIQDLTIKQKELKRHGRFSWSIRNKDKFHELVTKLRQYNEDLLRLLTKQRRQAFNITLPSYALTGVDHDREIQRLKDLESEHILLAHSAKLRLLQDGSRTHESAHHIATTEIEFKDKSDKNSRRVDGIYRFQSVWIEWKELDLSLTDADNSELRKRADRLCTLLSSVTVQALNIPRCLGIVEHVDATTSQIQRKLGFVYTGGSESGPALPESLLQVIDTYPEPSLGEKFKLAATLASSLALLHSSKWLHKGFHSANVLFLDQVKPTACQSQQTPHRIRCRSLRDPLITGFEYARLEDGRSIDYRPTGLKPLEYYYHPGVSNGFTKAYDWYSFGVMLLEIAWWNPLSKVLENDVPKEKRTNLKAIRDVFRESLHNLPAMTGDLYSEVVRICIESELPEHNDVELSRVVATKIVRPLKMCMA